VIDPTSKILFEVGSAFLSLALSALTFHRYLHLREGSMSLGLRSCVVLGSLAWLLSAGCGGGPEGGDVKLSEGGGTITYRGSPLAGASVTFVPEKGPLATALTDLSGNFKLSTGGQPGVAIGKCVVTVTAYEGGAAKPATSTGPLAPGSKPSDPEAVKKRMEEASQKMRTSAETPAAAGPKSIIPEIYAKQDTTPLKYTVEPDAKKNEFKIELKD
jgi:hypothetical protein